MGSLIDGAGVNPCLPISYFNTDTMYDLLVGDAVRGVDGKWYIRGGCGPFGTGVAGWNNTFKSTYLDSLIGRVMGIYPRVEAFVVDTEGVKVNAAERVTTCAGEHGSKIDPSDITRVSSATNSLQDIWNLVLAVGEEKEKNRADYTVETPFPDPLTGKPMIAWIPTIFFFDSFSELISSEEDTMMADKGLDEKAVKTIHMIEGNKKTIFVKHLRPKMERWGISIFATAHLGKNIVIDGPPGMRPKKQMQFMSASDKLKGVSGKFAYLIRNHLETSAKVLKDSDRSALYGNDGKTADTDINEVTLTLQRTKNSLIGMTLPFTVAQSYGLDNGLTDYHFLRTLHKYAGLVGSQQNHASALLPDTKVSRHTVRGELAKDRRLRRALQVCAQLVFVRENWPIVARFPGLAELTPEKMMDKLSGKTTPTVDTILESRGYWTYNKKEEREYFSILDIIELMEHK